VPEGIEKFTVEGKDFSMSVDWTEFKTYSPNSDFQQSDPHYSKYESKSPTAARKAYLLLKSDPNQLKSITWNDLPKWFDKNKIQYAYGGSSWH
jgi:hypothetical protein